MRTLSHLRRYFFFCSDKCDKCGVRDKSKHKLCFAFAMRDRECVCALLALCNFHTHFAYTLIARKRDTNPIFLKSATRWSCCFPSVVQTFPSSRIRRVYYEYEYNTTQAQQNHADAAKCKRHTPRTANVTAIAKRKYISTIKHQPTQKIRLKTLLSHKHKHLRIMLL